MTTIFLDTNIVLDVLLERHPFLHESAAVWSACDTDRCIGFISAASLTTVFYIARRQVGLEKARAAVELCLQAFQIAPVNRIVLETALGLPGNDFEDNVQLACANIVVADAVVTRDPAGFSASPIPVLSPSDAVQRLSV